MVGQSSSFSRSGGSESGNGSGGGSVACGDTSGNGGGAVVPADALGFAIAGSSGFSAGGRGGGVVTVTLSAKGDLKGVKIDDSLLKPSEKEIVEDLIVAAHADARRKAEGVLQEKMKEVTGGLPLPPGLGLT